LNYAIFVYYKLFTYTYINLLICILLYTEKVCIIIALCLLEYGKLSFSYSVKNYYCRMNKTNRQINMCTDHYCITSMVWSQYCLCNSTNITQSLSLGDIQQVFRYHRLLSLGITL
jgi:hypothetical protein